MTEAAVPSWTPGAMPEMERAEVRDVLAWTRLLADPGDASAVVRALARPPIELRQVDVARVIQIARRNKLDMVAALRKALESSQLPPEARTRIKRFLELHRAAADALDLARPDLLARAALGAEAEAPSARTGEDGPGGAHAGAGPASRDGPEEALRDMHRILREEVFADVRRIGAHLTELRLDTDIDIAHGVARYLELLKLSALAGRPPEQSLEDALADVNARLTAAATALQREILQSSPLDATLTAGAYGQEPGGSETGARPQTGGGTAADLAFAPPAARARARSPRGEPSLVPFLPRKGGGLALSASDIETYRGCPLRYKFARVLRIPTEPTTGQRFGIVVHQVLERYHAASGESLGALLDLFEASWRRGGFREGPSERELHAKARIALERYHARLHGDEFEPVWFERQFSLRIGPHHLRGRVDRVDRLPSDPSSGLRARVSTPPETDIRAGRAGAAAGQPGGAAAAHGAAVMSAATSASESHGGVERYELIDYKTSRPKSAEQLEDDIQLSLYALAAREAWRVEAASRAYHYVLDDQVVRLPGRTDEERVKAMVLEVGEGIMAQRFEPTPSKAACSLCDFRIVCPAAER
jgi:DNA helicase II / ATP-dependent DNA helicase PcrA